MHRLAYLSGAGPRCARDRGSRCVAGALVAGLLLAVAALLLLAAPPPASAAGGDLLWMQTWLPRSDFVKYGGKDLVRGRGGDLWLGVGGSVSSTDSPYVKRLCVARYSASGARRWARVLPSPVDMTYFAGMAVDRWRNTAVAGWRLDYDAPHGYPWVLTKLSPAGKRLWTRTCSSPVVDDGCYPKAVACDSKGSFYVAGTMARSKTGTDVTLVKYSTDGVKQWQRFIVGYEGSNDDGAGVVVDGSDRIYLTGTVGSFFSGKRVAVARYRPSGRRVWVKRWDLPTAVSADETATDIAASAAGVAVSGTASGMPDGDDRGFIVSVTPAGAVSHQATSIPGKDVSWASVAINAAGDVAAGGSVRGPTIDYFAYARYRVAGSDSVAYYTSPAEIAWCTDVWLGADATLAAAGGWYSSVSPSDSDTHVVLDRVEGADWHTTLPAAGLQQGDALLASASSVYVAGESGYPLALWSLER